MAIDFKPLTLTPIEFSLTAGTSIPAPPDSPPRTPIDGKSSNLDKTAKDAKKLKPVTNGSLETPDSKQAPPLSPLSETSQTSNQKRKTGGVRKFLSLRSLRGEDKKNKGGKLHKDPPDAAKSPTTSKVSYDNSRPTSPLSANSVEVNGTNPQNTLKHKKSAGWFNSASGRRKSTYVIGRLDEQIAEPAKKGPPPPSIPELGTFAKGLDGGEFGGADLFKNIGNDIKVEELSNQEKLESVPVKKESKEPIKELDAAKEKSLEPTSEKSALPTISEAEHKAPVKAAVDSPVEEPVVKKTPVEVETNPTTTKPSAPVLTSEVPKVAAAEEEVNAPVVATEQTETAKAVSEQPPVAESKPAMETAAPVQEQTVIKEPVLEEAKTSTKEEVVAPKPAAAEEIAKKDTES